MITEAIQGETVNSYTAQQGFDLLVSAHDYIIHCAWDADTSRVLGELRSMVIKEDYRVYYGSLAIESADRWAYIAKLKQRLGEK